MDNIAVFDRRQLVRQRDRAAGRFADHDFLFREAGARLADRLEDVTRTFPQGLDLGCRTGLLAEMIVAKVGQLWRCDLSPAMAAAAGPGALIADEEALPFAEASLDLVISNLALHWVNDLPGCLLQIRHALKEDGLFLASLFGGDTLIELRRALMDAELEITGGASPRVSPLIDVRDAGALLQRAGFALAVVDTDRITVTYGDVFRLLADLRGMGETNAVAQRSRRFLPRAVLWRALELYRDRHAGPDGRVPASFEIITLTAWRPHASQQRPQRPGSAAMPLADGLAGRAG